MKLFTTIKCPKCHKIKSIFNLEALGIKEYMLTDTNVDALTELAWHGLIDQARKSLPILVDDYGNIITDIKRITEMIAKRSIEVLAELNNASKIVCEGDVCRLS